MVSVIVSDVNVRPCFHNMNCSGDRHDLQASPKRGLQRREEAEVRECARRDLQVGELF